MTVAEKCDRMGSRRLSWVGWLILGTAVACLVLAGLVWPPYTALAVGVLVPVFFLLIQRPDWAFAVFFAVETLFSEDILLVTEQLADTIYRINIPYIGINVFEAALLILVAVTLLQRRGVIRGTPLDFCMAFFALACAGGYLTGVVLYHDPARVFEPRRLLHFFLGYFLAANLIRTRESLRIFMTLFFIAVSLKALQGIYLFTAGSGLLIKWKIRALFTGWEDSLCFVTFLMMMAVFWIERTPFPGKRWFLILAPAVFFSFLFSYKRAYYIAVVTGAATLFWVQGGKARFRMLGAMIVTGIVILILITAAGQWNAIGMRVASIVNPTEESSANYRLVEWRNAMISIRHHPLSGIGLGGIMPMEIWLSRTNLLGVHNTFLWVTVKMGVLGLFSLLLLHLAFLKQLFVQNRRLCDPFLTTVSHGITCAFVAFVTAEMFAPMFTQMRTATWLGVFLALGMGLVEMERREGNPR